MENSKRKTLSSNSPHRELYLFFSIAAIIPTLVISLCMIYLVFSMTTKELGIPQELSCYILPATKKVILLTLLCVPATLGAVLYLAYRVTHRILGHYDRLVRELDQILEGKKNTPIKIRTKDTFKPLVDRINKIVERLWKATKPPISS